MLNDKIVVGGRVTNIRQVTDIQWYEYESIPMDVYGYELNCISWVWVRELCTCDLPV
jgi:hypothetical protein